MELKQLMTDKTHDLRAFWRTHFMEKKSSTIEASNSDLHKHFKDRFENISVTADKQWATYISEHNQRWLFSPEEAENKILDRPFTMEEIQKCIKELRSGKSPGVDGLITEMFKAGNDTLSQFFIDFFNQIYDSAIYPDIWQQQLLCPIFKKGDPLDAGNYRRVSLISIF